MSPDEEDRDDLRLPIVQAGDPVLRRPTCVVPIDEIGSDRIQRLIDAMIATSPAWASGWLRPRSASTCASR
jgi:hypothetical protein